MSTEYFRLNHPINRNKSSTGLSWQMQLVVFLIAVLAVISRRPDAVTNPQFFAEDGAVWYADAYQLGLHSLLVPDAGYLQIFPRVVAALATLVPLLFAPLLMSVIGIVVQVLPVNVLASSRYANWGSLSLRLIMGFLYLALPNSRELDVVITNAQWHLALLACIVVLAPSPVTWKERGFDLWVLLLSGLTGPFCVLLLPIGGIIWWVRRGAWRIATNLLIGACAVTQLLVLHKADPAIRSSAPLGASPRLFIDILSGHVFLAAIFGFDNYPARFPLGVMVLIAILGSAILAYTLFRVKLEFRFFIIFSLLIFAASLRSPLVSRSDPQWQVLDQAYGIRYWFYPMLAFLWSLLWCAQPGQIRWVRRFAVVMLVLVVIGITKDWEYPPFSDHHFAQYAKKFEEMPRGEAMVFPLYPDGWTMQLVKRGDNCRVLPIGFIDQPPDNAQESGSIAVSGWVNAPEPVEKISIYLDGSLKQSFQPNALRPDVDRKYPGGPVKEKGWQTSLDLSKANSGMHLLEVHARLRDGCDGVIGIKSVETI